MKYAAKQANDIVYAPFEARFLEENRYFQGCPSVAVTPKGRIFLSWVGGGTREPHIENYGVLNYSDDNGKTWNQLFVIPSSPERRVHTVDPQLWIAPDGRLHLFWAQNDIYPVGEGPDGFTVEGWVFCDCVHAQWQVICDNPDAPVPCFGAPVYAGPGFLRNRPIALPTGRILYCSYDQTCDRYAYSISDDGGRTLVHRYGSKKLPVQHDESMAYLMKDGRVRMMARTMTGWVAECYSADNGETWDDEARPTDIVNANTRFYIGRTPSGRILMVGNDSPATNRTDMAVYLSDDDGITFPYKRIIDRRAWISYPDADYHNGHIYITYDADRNSLREILLLECTEEEIMDENHPLVPRIISKPKTCTE